MDVQGEHHGTSAAIEFAVTVLGVCSNDKENAVQLAPVNFFILVAIF